MLRVESFRRRPELLHRRNEALLYGPVIDHIFVMVRAPAAEEVNQTAAIKRNWELLSEAELEILHREEAILVHVDVFDSAPHLCRLV